MTRLAIGGMVLDVDGGVGLQLLSRLQGFDVFAHEGQGAAVRLELDSAAPMPEVCWLHRFDIVDGEMVCRFGRTTDGGYCYAFDSDSWLLCPPADTETPYRLSPVAHPSLLRFALWLVYSMAGLRRRRQPVHTSVAVCHGRAVLCLGESGTGKSTHTRLWTEHIEGTHLLNDDSPILAVEADGLWVYGSPWSGKTPCFRDERWPVAALLRLEQRPENTIRRLGTVESFAALQPSCPPCLMKDEPLQDALVDYVGQVIQRAPVYRLGCLPDADAARLSYNTIFGPCR